MNTHTNDSSERKKVGMLVPPPVLLLALAVAAVVAHVLVFQLEPLHMATLTAGVAIALASLALIVLSGRRFRTAGTPVRPTSLTTAIVASGPYRLSRNPMYLGMAGLLAGAAVAASSYVFAVACALFCVVVHFGVIRPEERYLEALHGQAYLQYKQQVRRWF